MPRLRQITSALLSIIFLASLYAQEPLSLPRHMTPEEAGLMKDYLLQQSLMRSVPSPPPAPVRTMAEWEQLQALIITWAGQQTILKEIVRNSVKECKVLIVTDNPTNVTAQLTGAAIPLDSVRFVNTPFNTIWVRDYGPWAVYKNDVDSLWMVDWIYNRPRPQDDEVPLAIADYLGLPIYEATAAPDDWVHTGGNNLPDGMGNLFSSKLVLNENPDKTEAEIDTLAKKYLGIRQYIKFPTLPYDGIHHLDMHMRVIDEETILIGQYPDGVADGPQIEANIQYLQDSFRTAFGHPYKIIRLPMPPDANGRYPDNGGSYRTYTNSIFVNKTILVPTYQEKYDTTALRIYRESLPGYNVVGINCNSIIGSLGALHCITKTIGVEKPLLIAHSRLRDVADTVIHYPVSAYIRHRDGIAAAQLFYRAAPDSVYTEVDMFLSDTVGHIWSSEIPAFPAGTEVQYYIHAVALDGKEQVRPIVAPEGYFNFRILGEPANQPPFVAITAPEDESLFPLEAGSIQVDFDAADPDGSISLARFLVNGSEVSTLDTLPYAFDWILTDTGNFQLAVEVTDDDGAISLSEPVHVRIESISGISDEPNRKALAIYPNPAGDQVQVVSAKDLLQGIKVINGTGQNMIIPMQRDRYHWILDLSRLPSGLYFLQCDMGGKIQTYKLCKGR